ncbi:tail fiber domain-containing protein [Salmonella enterica]|nr:tail fiber domain-containing protein [Salmonella enterica]
MQDDVGRLITTIKDLDTQVALVAADGKLEPAQLPDNAAKVDAQGILLDTQLPAKVVVVDNNGTIPMARIPAGALTAFREVSNATAMTALVATAGDVVKRLDDGNYYMLAASPATVLANWRELPPTAVHSINGKTGAVTGIAEVDANGANSTIKTLKGLTAPFVLPADGQNGYEAVTYRQLQQITAGQGATMNGVMNNFIGAVEWFNGDRLHIPAGYVAADGQEVKRTDAATADLWLAVDKGMYVSVTEALWQDSGFATNPYANRASYSTGNGSTTFRMPDLNGVQPNSIPALFLRGGGGGTDAQIRSYGSTGSVYPNGAPNITGSINQSLLTYRSNTGTNVGVGAFAHADVKAVTGSGGAGAVGTSRPNYIEFTFDASAVHKAYGRIGPDGATPTGEVKPNAATGIWIIRASGAFQAANTSFDCITSDAVQPANGTTVTTGQFNTMYQVAGKPMLAAGFNAAMEINGRSRSVWGCAKFNPTTNALTWRHFDFDYETQDLITQGMVQCNGLYMIGRAVGSPSIMLLEIDKTGVTISNTRQNTTGGPRNIMSVRSATANPNDRAKGYLSVSGGYICQRGVDGNPNTDNAFNLNWSTQTPSGAAIEVWVDSTNVFNMNGNGTFPVASDRELKKDIRYIPQGSGALREVLRWQPARFKFKARGVVPESGENTGFIANDLKAISPDAVRGLGIPQGGDITEADVYSHHFQIDQMAMIAKLTLAVQELSQKNDELEKKIAKLSS